MSKTLKTRPATGILVPVIEEVRRISESERKELRESLEKARADIAAGDFDVVTPKSLRDEFKEIYLRIPTKPAMHSNRKPATCSDLKPARVPI